ncbi:MAG TPA: FlgD immunoglobulin-like domain containing protein [Chitinivibrionales bacterium]|nr:FlgD immunoglobulin-like domain containing protein [Chitinivibrionales bacterium]
MANQRISFVWCFVLSAGTALSCLGVPQTGGYVGKYPWVRTWQLPNTPDGMRPHACWHSIGNAPDGDIYVGGMDHTTNSALYRIYMSDDTLRYLGDAAAASEAVNNWDSGETCQKFHDRPTFHNGRVYVFSLDRSDISDAYLSTRGYHVYAYDVAQNTFSDMSVNNPGGVGAPHLQVVTLAPDPKNNRVYGAVIPTVDIVYYDVAKNLEFTVGRPATFTQYIYTNRFMFVDSRGRLYFTAGSEYWSPGSDPNIYNHVHYYEPSTNTFGDLTDWKLNLNAFEMGQWTRDRKTCYVEDNKGNTFRFDDSAAAWTSLGRPFPNDPNWIFQVSPNSKKIYSGNNTIVEYDIASGKVINTLCATGDLDAQAGAQKYWIGYDSWDNNGNFYFASFSDYGINVLVTRFNPVQLKIAKGILPALVQVEVAASSNANEFIVTRKGGSTSSSLDVVYNVDAAENNASLMKQARGTVTIPPGQDSATAVLTQDQLALVSGKYVFTVIGDGDQYLPGAHRSVSAVNTGVVAKSNHGPESKQLLSCFRSGAGAITFRVFAPEGSSMTHLSIYDLHGKCVKVLHAGAISSGSHDFTLDEGSMAKGTYVARLTLDRQTVQRRVAKY